MTRKHRLLFYFAVVLVIPILIWIIYPEDWRQTIPWLIGGTVLLGGYEIYCWKAGKK